MGVARITKIHCSGFFSSLSKFKVQSFCTKFSSSSPRFIVVANHWRVILLSSLQVQSPGNLLIIDTYYLHHTLYTLQYTLYSSTNHGHIILAPNQPRWHATDATASWDSPSWIIIASGPIVKHPLDDFWNKYLLLHPSHSLPSPSSSAC